MFARIVSVAMVIIAVSNHSLFAEKATADNAEAFAKKWVAAYNENDVKKQIAFYENSKKLQVIVSAGVQHNGYDEMKQAYVDTFRDFETTDSEAKKLKTNLFGETAIVTFEHRFKIRHRTENFRLQFHIRTSMVLKHVEGQWKIIHEHSSPIADINRFEEIQ